MEDEHRVCNLRVSERKRAQVGRYPQMPPPPWTAPLSFGLRGPEGLAGGTEVGEEGSGEQRRPRLSPPSRERGLE